MGEEVPLLLWETEDFDWESPWVSTAASHYTIATVVAAAAVAGHKELPLEGRSCSCMLGFGELARSLGVDMEARLQLSFPRCYLRSRPED